MRFMRTQQRGSARPVLFSDCCLREDSAELILPELRSEHRGFGARSNAALGQESLPLPSYLESLVCCSLQN